MIKIFNKIVIGNTVLPPLVGENMHISLSYHSVPITEFDRLVKEYAVIDKYNPEGFHYIYGEAWNKKMHKVSNLKIDDLQLTIFSELIDNPAYTDEAAKEHCRQTREDRIAQAKRELEYLPKVNCETEGRMVI